MPPSASPLSTCFKKNDIVAHFSNFFAGNIWVIPWETGPLKIFTSPILVKHSGYLYWVKLWWATKFFGIWTIFGYPSGQFSKMAVFGQKMTENWPFFKSDIDTSFLMTHRAVICLKKALGALFQYNVHLFT